MKFTDNMLAEARLAKSAEELLALAEKNDIEMTVEEAEANFAVLGGKTGELADDELDNVAGGACRYKDGRPVVTVAHDCSNWRCKHDGSEEKIKPMGAWICRTCGIRTYCNTCKYCSYEKGLWLCNNIKNQI